MVGDSDLGRIRWWAAATVLAHAVSVLAWLAAGLWQGPRYSWLEHTISDMYAVSAPHGWFLIVVLTLSGASAVGFSVFSLRPSLRAGGWPATVGTILLALSIQGLGDLLSVFEREACRRADPGCSSADQVTNVGGALDSALSSVGLLLLVAAGFFIASAMRGAPGWQAWVWPTRGVALLVLALLVATVGSAPVGLGGLFERLLAAVAAGGVIALAVGVLRHAGAERVGS